MGTGEKAALVTLVEVKQSTNTDIRQKVVGQMLDDAANAVAHWTVEEIRAKFENRCQAEQKVTGAEHAKA